MLATRAITAGLLGRAQETTSVFLQWWARELNSVLPPTVRRNLFSDGRVVTIVPREEAFILTIPGVKGAFPETHSLARQGTMSPNLQAAIKRADAIELVLPRAKILRRLLDLPWAASSSLATAVPFMIERETPFKLDQATYAFRIVRRDVTKRIIQIELAVTSRAALNLLVSELDAAAIRLSAIRVEGEETRAFDLAEACRRRTRSWVRDPGKLTLALAPALLFGGLAITSVTIHARLMSLDAELASQETAAKQAALLRDDLAAVTQTRRVLDTRASEPMMAETLAKLSALIPDGSWVFSLDAKRAEIQIEGFSTDLPALLGSLERSYSFEAPEFTSPVVHDAASGRDRFALRLRVRGAPP